MSLIIGFTDIYNQLKLYGIQLYFCPETYILSRKNRCFPGILYRTKTVLKRGFSRNST